MSKIYSARRIRKQKEQFFLLLLALSIVLTACIVVLTYNI